MSRSSIRCAAVGSTLCLALWLGIAASPARAANEADDIVPDDEASDDSTFIQSPPFPGLDFRRALRFQASSRFLPNAGVDSGHVDLYNPELRAQLTLPINDRAVVRVNTRGAWSRYVFRGDPPIGGHDDPLNLYQARILVDGAYQLTDEGQSWLVEGESWSLLGSVFGQSAWEETRFDAGVSTGIGIGIGYRIPDRFRIGIGAVVRTELHEGGADFGPFASFRWHITEALTLRDRGLGLLLDYHVSRKVEIFVSGFRSSNSFRLKNQLGADDITFRDRQLLVGAGFEWRITKSFHVTFEAGGVAWRELRVHSDDLGGTIFSDKPRPTPYFDLRFELRPGRH